MGDVTLRAGAEFVFSPSAHRADDEP